MSDQIREELSALVDNELPPGRMTALFDRLRSDADLRREWGRHHEIGDLIRGDASGLSLQGLADRVRERLADEPVIIAPRPRTSPGTNPGTNPGRPRIGWGQAAAGFALAASVAGVSVYLAPLLSSPVEAPAPRLAQTPPTVTTPPLQMLPSPTPDQMPDQLPAQTPGLMQVAQAPIDAPQPSQRWKRLPQDEVATRNDRLNRYLVDHSAFSAPAGIAGLLPYATLVAHDPSR
jgi:sigma-E factor negative regulatory protein RseA